MKNQRSNEPENNKYCKPSYHTLQIRPSLPLPIILPQLFNLLLQSQTPLQSRTHPIFSPGSPRYQLAAVARMYPLPIRNILFEAFFQFELATAGTVGEETDDACDDEGEEGDADDDKREGEDFHDCRVRDHIAEADCQSCYDRVVDSVDVGHVFDFTED